MDTENRRIAQLEAKVAILEKQVAHYEEKLGLSGEKTNASVQGYLAFQKLLQQHIDWVEKFKITADIIEGKKNDNASFERTDAMFKSLPENILALEKLKEQLKIKFDPEEGKPKMTATSPQSLAAVLIDDENE